MNPAAFVVLTLLIGLLFSMSFYVIFGGDGE
jgi:hypothetical protein